MRGHLLGQSAEKVVGVGFRSFGGVRDELIRHDAVEQIGQLAEESVDGLTFAGEGEDFLELVDDDERTDGAPLMVEVAETMEKFPQGFLLFRGVERHEFLGTSPDGTAFAPRTQIVEGGRHGAVHLLGVGLGVVLETYAYGEVALVAHERKNAGIDDRALADARTAVEHGLRAAGDLGGELGYLFVAAVEHLAFHVGVEAFPGG